MKGPSKGWLELKIMKSRLGTDGSENKKGVMDANNVVGHWKNDRWCWIIGCWITMVMLFLRVVVG